MVRWSSPGSRTWRTSADDLQVAARDGGRGQVAGPREEVRVPLVGEVGALRPHHEAHPRGCGARRLGLPAHEGARVHEQVLAHAIGEEHHVPTRPVELEPCFLESLLDFGSRGHRPWFVGERRRSQGGLIANSSGARQAGSTAQLFLSSGSVGRGSSAVGSRVTSARTSRGNWCPAGSVSSRATRSSASVMPRRFSSDGSISMPAGGIQALVEGEPDHRAVGLVLGPDHAPAAHGADLVDVDLELLAHLHPLLDDGPEAAAAQVERPARQRGGARSRTKLTR